MSSVPLRVSFSDSAAFGGGISTKKAGVLVVDDDGAMLAALGLYFERRGFHTVVAASLESAKKFARLRPGWALVMSDYHLPDGTGLELEAWMRTQTFAPPPQFVLMSGSGGQPFLHSGVEFLAKPFSIQDLDARVEALLRGAQSGPLGR